MSLIGGFLFLEFVKKDFKSSRILVKVWSTIVFDLEKWRNQYVVNRELANKVVTTSTLNS